MAAIRMMSGAQMKVRQVVANLVITFAGGQGHVQGLDKFASVMSHQACASTPSANIGELMQTICADFQVVANSFHTTQPPPSIPPSAWCYPNQISAVDPVLPQKWPRTTRRKLPISCPPVAEGACGAAGAPAGATLNPRATLRMMRRVWCSGGRGATVGRCWRVGARV